MRQLAQEMVQGLSMRAIISTFGTTGDIQPLLALGLELQRYDHQPVFVVAQHLAPIVERLGLAVVSVGPDLSIAHRHVIQGLVEGWESSAVAEAAYQPLLQAMPLAFRELIVICRDADVLISVSDLPFLRMIHDLTGTPYVSVQLSHPDADNWAYFSEIRALLNPGRARLGLPAIPEDEPMPFTGNSPELALVAISRYVIERSPRWTAQYRIVGFFYADESNWMPDAELAAFLATDEPVVVVSFGSMITDDPQRMTVIVLAAIAQAGCRAILQYGWNGLAASVQHLPGIHPSGFVPHSWLFPRAACVVHHGGAGTLAAAMHAGVPSIPVPHCADQFDLGRISSEVGCSADVIPLRELTAERLSLAISETLINPAYRQAAQSLGVKIRAEQGVQTARAAIEQLVASRKPHPVTVRR